VERRVGEKRDCERGKTKFLEGTESVERRVGKREGERTFQRVRVLLGERKGDSGILIGDAESGTQLSV
jgi:ribosomal protein S8E